MKLYKIISTFLKRLICKHRFLLRRITERPHLEVGMVWEQEFDGVILNYRCSLCGKDKIFHLC